MCHSTPFHLGILLLVIAQQDVIGLLFAAYRSGGDDHLCYVLSRGDLVHGREHHAFHDGAQSARTRATLNGKLGDLCRNKQTETEEIDDVED